MTPLVPKSIAPPFAAYSHGVLCQPASMVVTSGQLGMNPDETIPDGAQAQTEICLQAIDHILAEAGLDRAHVVRLNAYVTDRSHMAGYMIARDTWLDGLANLPASTLMIVSGFTRPEFVVEVEAIAVKEIANASS